MNFFGLFTRKPKSLPKSEPQKPEVSLPDWVDALYNEESTNPEIPFQKNREKWYNNKKKWYDDYRKATITNNKTPVSIDEYYKRFTGN